MERNTKESTLTLGGYLRHSARPEMTSGFIRLSPDISGGILDTVSKHHRGVEMSDVVAVIVGSAGPVAQSMVVTNEILSIRRRDGTALVARLDEVKEIAASGPDIRLNGEVVARLDCPNTIALRDLLGSVQAYLNSARRPPPAATGTLVFPSSELELVCRSVARDEPRSGSDATELGDHPEASLALLDCDPSYLVGEGIEPGLRNLVAFIMGIDSPDGIVAVSLLDNAGFGTEALVIDATGLYSAAGGHFVYVSWEELAWLEITTYLHEGDCFGVTFSNGKRLACTREVLLMEPYYRLVRDLVAHVRTFSRPGGASGEATESGVLPSWFKVPSALRSDWYYDVAPAWREVKAADGAADTALSTLKLSGMLLSNAAILAGKVGAAVLRELPEHVSRQKARVHVEARQHADALEREMRRNANLSDEQRTKMSAAAERSRAISEKYRADR